MIVMCVSAYVYFAGVLFVFKYYCLCFKFFQFIMAVQSQKCLLDSDESKIKEVKEVRLKREVRLL